MSTGSSILILGLAITLHAELAAPPAATTATPSPTRPQVLRYYEVPLMGTFGKEIQPSGIQDILKTASKQDVDYVVFKIDSGGGLVSTGREIANLMAQFDKDLDFIALIDDEALSAAMWVVLSCDQVFMVSGATAGGATTYMESKSGAIEYDAKINSIVASEMSAIAEKHGHSPVLVRAMCLLDAKAFLVASAQGTVAQVFADAPADGSKFESMDSETTILTLTTGEAVRCGFARIADADVGKLGDKLGASRWVKKSNYGQLAMKRAYGDFQEMTRLNARIEDLLADRPAIVRFIQANTDDAYAKDPDNFRYELDYTVLIGGSPRVTEQSWRTWYANTDAAIAAWDRVLVGLRALDQLDVEASRRGEPESSAMIDLADHANRALREMTRLRNNRGRGPTR